MSSASENTLKFLCSETNKIRDTYYGSVYRASFSINGEKGDWDILQISIPLSPLKEAELMRRFSIDREDLPAFYARFEKAVVRHSDLIKNLNATGQDSIRRSIVEYKTIKYYPRMSRDGNQIGQDFYFVTVPMDSFVGTDIFREQGAYLYDINNLAIRLLQSAKVFSENGFTLGAVDLDSCYYADADGKKFLKLGYSFYGTGPNTAPDTYTQDVSPFISERISGGTEEQSLDSDVRMVCAYIWTILDGRHYSEPNTNAWIAANFYSIGDDFPINLAPAYAPQQLTDLLVEGMIRGAESMKALQMGIRAVNKAIAANELENVYIVFSEPGYLSAPLPDLREEAIEEEPEPSVAPPPDRQRGKGKKNKARKGGIAVVILAAILLLGAVGYFVLGPEIILGIFGTTELPMSASAGLYENDGKVLNANATENPKYAIDAEGNMVSADNSDKVIFLKEQVSPFVFVDDLKIAITDKKFDRYHRLDSTEKILRDYVVDLRNVDNLAYDSYLGEDNRIPNRIIEEYGITDETLVLMKDSMYPDTGYKVAMLVKKEPEVPALEEKPDEADSGEAFPESVSDDEKETSDDEGIEEESSAVRAVTGVSEDALFLVQGEWTFTLNLSLFPQNAIDRKVSLSCEETEYMYFVVENKDGQKSKARTVKLSVREDDETKITAVGLVEGKYIIRIESDDGALLKKIALTFEPASTSPMELPQQPTPTPQPKPTPTPTPTPEITPAPTPVPYSPYYGGNGYTDGGYGYSSEPAPAPTPVAMPAPDPPPAPEQNLPLSCSIDHLDLRVGESCRLGDYLDGVENFALLICRVSEEGVVAISPGEGFLVSAAAEGETVIRISKGEQSVEISVSVYA